ncbi:MAG: hypothetical protein H5T96_09920, partial [Tissierellales bacterium]|nr:hypothetical protein [Tissierellales bacterium]
EEIRFQQAIYDKITIQSGNSSFRPNLGVAQGSIISPALFDIYIEPLLSKLCNIVHLSDVFAYADDIMVLCEDQKTLMKIIEVIEEWSKENNMKINKSKSAILEFKHRMKRKSDLEIGDNILGYPIVGEYKYLGTWFNQKLTMSTQIKHIEKNMNFIRTKLSPALYNSSLDLRKNLWQVFVCPSIEFLLPLYSYEEAITNREKIQTLVRNSYRSYTGLKGNTSKDLLESLMGYNIDERSKELKYISEQKWRCREEHTTFEQKNDEYLRTLKKLKPENWCKNQPKLMIKYINIQTALCPKCKANEIKARCSVSHLERKHNIQADSIEKITTTIMKLTDKEAKKKREDKTKLTRSFIVKRAEELIKPNLEKLKNFLNVHNEVVPRLQAN